MGEVLLGPGDVDMSLQAEIICKASQIPGMTESDDVMIHYTVTRSCPFNCRGCINALTAASGNGTSFPRSTGHEDREDLDRDIKAIAQLIRRSGKKEAVLVYYGGEPMLRMNKPSTSSGTAMKRKGSSPISPPISPITARTSRKSWEST